MKTITNINNKETIHIGNSQRVPRIISGGPISRVGLSRLTGLTQPAIGNLTGQMLADGIIEEAGKLQEDTGAGRRPVLLSLTPSWGYIGCISIDRDEICAGICDLGGSIVLSPCYFPYPDDVEQTLDLLCDTLKDMIRTHLPANSRIIGVGVIAPGPLNSSTGMMINPPSFDRWNGLNLLDEMRKRLPWPVFTEHNSTAIARAELRLVSSEKYRNFAIYFINAGIGLGLVLNGEIYTGIDGIGCEIGHTSIDVNGRLCSCGNRGCLDLYASTAAVVHDARRVDGSLDSWRKIVDRAIDSCDRFCDELLKLQASYLAGSMINLDNLLTLDAIIIAGQATYRGEYLCDKIRRRISRSLAGSGRVPDIRLSSISGHTSLSGAGAVVLSQFFYNELFLSCGLTI